MHDMAVPNGKLHVQIRCVFARGLFSIVTQKKKFGRWTISQAVLITWNTLSKAMKKVNIK